MSEVAIIIPCFNEEHRLSPEALTAFLEQHPDISIWLVNDGSTDKTARLIDHAAQINPRQIKILHLERNVGKAEAVRQGMKHVISQSDAQWLGYWDADLATPLDEIDHLLNCKNEQTRLLMCSRVKRLGATIRRHAWRHVLGRVMATFIATGFKLPAYDTQCGAKLIHRQAVSQVFSEPFLSHWLFDVEIILRIMKMYENDAFEVRISEVPVRQWQDVKGSKLLFRRMIFSLVDLLRIYLKSQNHSR